MAVAFSPRRPQTLFFLLLLHASVTSALSVVLDVDVHDAVETEGWAASEVLPDCGTVKIFYALLKAASDRLPQQREPPLVGFGNLQGLVSFIPLLLPSSRLHLGLDCVLAVGNFLFSMLRIP